MSELDCIDFEKFYSDALQDDFDTSAVVGNYPNHFDELESTFDASPAATQKQRNSSSDYSQINRQSGHPQVQEEPLASTIAQGNFAADCTNQFDNDPEPLSWIPSNRTAQPREQFSVNDYTDLAANFDQPAVLPPVDVALNQNTYNYQLNQVPVESPSRYHTADMVQNYQQPLDENQYGPTTIPLVQSIQKPNPTGYHQGVGIDGDCQTDSARTKYIINNQKININIRKSFDRETQTADGNLRAISEQATSPVRQISSPVRHNDPVPDMDVENPSNFTNTESEVRYVAEIQRLRRSMTDQKQFHEERLQQLDTEESHQKQSIQQLQATISQMEQTSQDKDEQLRAAKSELQLSQSAAASPRRSKEKEEMAELKRLVSHLRDDAIGHQTELSKAKGSVSDLEGDLKQVKNQYQIALDDQQKREKIIQSNTTEIDRLKNELRMAHERVHKAEVASNRLTTDKTSLEDNIRSMNVALNEKDKEIEKHIQETHTARSDHSSSESEKSKIEHLHNTLKQEHTVLQREFTKSQSKYDLAQANYTDLDKKFKNLKLEVAQLQHASHQPQQSHQPHQSHQPQSVVRKSHNYEPQASPSPVRNKPITRRDIAMQQSVQTPMPSNSAEYENDNWAPTNSEMRVIRKVLNHYSDPHAAPPAGGRQQQPIQSAVIRNQFSNQQEGHYDVQQQRAVTQEKLDFGNTHLERQSYESPQRSPQRVSNDRIVQPLHNQRVDPPKQMTEPSKVVNSDNSQITQSSGGMCHLGGGLSGLAGFRQPQKPGGAFRPVQVQQHQQSTTTHSPSPPREMCTQQWLEDKIVELSHDRSLRIDELAKIHQSKPKSIAERKYKMKQEQDLQVLEKEINSYKMQLRKLSHPVR